MEIIDLRLINFRNFLTKRIEFSPKLTVIIGPNGSGKSNILEAIGLLSAIKSTRVQTDYDLVKFGKTEAKIEGKIEGFEPKTLTINFQVIDELYVKKAYFIDSVKKRLIDLSDFLSLVVFGPSDLDLVTGSPAIRRHHLDSELTSIDRNYWRAISGYNKVIVRRNRVLQRISEGFSKPQELDFWDERLIAHAKYISQKRQEFFEFLNLPAGRQVLWDYSWQLNQSQITQDKLLRNRGRDIAAGFTLSGPHRDDFQFVYRSKNLEFFGSRGEQRMAVLALKLAELEFYSVKRQTRPILALDDIFSELDWEHREAVLSVIDKQQTIITAAERESVPKELFKKAKLVELR